MVNRLSNLGCRCFPEIDGLPLTVFLARDQSHGLQCANHELGSGNCVIWRSRCQRQRQGQFDVRPSNPAVPL